MKRRIATLLLYLLVALSLAYIAAAFAVGTVLSLPIVIPLLVVDSVVRGVRS